MFHTARSVFACLAALQKLHICDPLASGSPGASGAMTSIEPHAVGADSISARSSGRLRVSRGPGVPGPYRYTKLQHTQPRQQRLDTDQDQHNAADALGGGAVLVAEHGTDLDADGGQQAGDNTLQKVLDTINGMVAMASGSMALAE